MILQMMMQAAQQGMSPSQFMQQYAQQDPRVAQLMQLTNGKSREQLMQTASNMAQQRGTTIEEVAKRMGLPMNK